MIRRLALCLFLTLSPASAQDAGVAKSIASLLNQLGPASKAPAGATATPAKAVDLSFKPSAQVRQKAIDTFVEGFREVSPDAADQIAQAFKQQDVFAALGSQVKAEYGLNINNVADAWAVYWSYLWLFGQGDGGDPTKAQVLGLRQQFQTLFSGLPEIANASEARRQELADALTLQLLVLSQVSDQYKDQPENLKEFASALSKQLGLDVNRFTLTGSGFQLKK